MLDVHVPHSTHTWKEFSIHIATITIGLLIAVSLEQTVEYLHRQHKLQKLQGDLHEEGLESREIAKQDIAFLNVFMSKYAEQLRLADVELASRSHRAPRFSAQAVPEAGPPEFVMPPQAAWTSARESGLTALLPREIQRSYTRLYTQFDLILRYEIDRRNAVYDLNGFVCRFGDGTLPCNPELRAMSVEELKEYQTLSMKVFTRAQAVKHRLLSLMNFNQVILDGQVLTGTEEESIKSYRRLNEQNPDQFLAPAEPAARP